MYGRIRFRPEEAFKCLKEVMLCSTKYYQAQGALHSGLSIVIEEQSINTIAPKE